MKLFIKEQKFFPLSSVPKSDFYRNLRSSVLSCFSCVQLFATLRTDSTMLFCPWDFPGKNTEVGCQRIFPTQGSNAGPPASPALHADSLPQTTRVSPECIYDQIQFGKLWTLRIELINLELYVHIKNWFNKLRWVGFSPGNLKSFLKYDSYIDTERKRKRQVIYRNIIANDHKSQRPARISQLPIYFLWGAR